MAPLIVMEDIVVKAGSSQCPVAAPLEVSLHYHVSRPVVRPVWTLTYVADIASEKVESVLAVSTRNDGHLALTAAGASSGATDQLAPGVKYTLDAAIPGHIMQCELVDKVALKYLFQIGTFTFTLGGEGADDRIGEPVHDVVNLVCQVRPAGDGALIRTLLQG